MSAAEGRQPWKQTQFLLSVMSNLIMRMKTFEKQTTITDLLKGQDTIFGGSYLVVVNSRFGKV